MKRVLSIRDAANLILHELTRRKIVPHNEPCYVNFRVPRPWEPERELEVEVMWGDDLPEEPSAEVIRLDDYR